MTIKELKEAIKDMPDDMLVTSESSEWTTGAEVIAGVSRNSNMQQDTFHINARDRSKPDGSTHSGEYNGWRDVD